MRVNPVYSYPKTYTNKNATNFTGTRQTRYVDVGGEEDVRYYFDEKDISKLGRQRFVLGQQPLVRLRDSYAPSVIMKGTVYVCDWDEWATDRAKETNGAVIVDKGKETLTEDKLLDFKEISPDEIKVMQKCLSSDISYHRSRLKHIKNQLESPDKTEDEKRFLAAEQRRRIARLNELVEMKKLADKDLEDAMAFLEAHNFDYEREKQRRALRAQGYCI